MHFLVRFLIISGCFIPLLSAAYPSAPAYSSTPIKYDSRTTIESLKEITDLLRKDYVDNVDEKKMLEGALNGMLTALDPHSSYLDPESYQELLSQTKGEFGGLGMEVTMENTLVKIIAPIDDTPAFRAGLKEKDLILAIDNQSVSGLTLSEAVKKMRGEPGTTVKLLIKREGKEPFDVVLKRELIKVKSVKWQIEGDVGYIRISTFDEKTYGLLKEAVHELKKKGGNNLVGLLLDLRNNPGGLLEQAIAVSDLFLTKGEIVSTRGRDPQKDIHIKATPKEEILKGLPLVVLINGGSASASEIVAGALQDNRRALVVGTRSFGKGSVQTIRPLNNGGAIKFTISRYYKPDGTSIQAKGIHPDIQIEQVAYLEKIDEADRLREENFSGALKAEDPSLSKEKKADPEKTPSKGGDSTRLAGLKSAKEKIVDYQKIRAMDMVRCVSLYERNLKFQ